MAVVRDEDIPGVVSPGAQRTAPEEAAQSGVGVPDVSEEGANVVAGRVGTLEQVNRLFTQPSEAPKGTQIPDRFTAVVTAHKDLARDRQLLVLDDKLLFEGDEAGASAIDVGAAVDVVKVSSRRGRKYQITGPARRPFEALRIRCERTDLSRGNRNKCLGMMGG